MTSGWTNPWTSLRTSEEHSWDPGLSGLGSGSRGPLLLPVLDPCLLGPRDRELTLFWGSLFYPARHWSALPGLGSFHRSVYGLEIPWISIPSVMTDSCGKWHAVWFYVCEVWKHVQVFVPFMGSYLHKKASYGSEFTVIMWGGKHREATE